MFISFAEIIVYFLEIYAAIGFIFAVWFVIFGVTRLDEAAKGTGFGFRLLIFGGVVAFWWLLLWRLLDGTKRPMENNAHRREAAK
jgi:hypothetical protein